MILVVDGRSENWDVPALGYHINASNTYNDFEDTHTVGFTRQMKRSSLELGEMLEKDGHESSDVFRRFLRRALTLLRARCLVQNFIQITEVSVNIRTTDSPYSA